MNDPHDITAALRALLLSGDPAQVDQGIELALIEPDARLVLRGILCNEGVIGAKVNAAHDEAHTTKSIEERADTGARAVLAVSRLLHRSFSRAAPLDLPLAHRFLCGTHAEITAVLENATVEKRAVMVKFFIAEAETYLKRLRAFLPTAGGASSPYANQTRYIGDQSLGQAGLARLAELVKNGTLTREQAVSVASKQRNHTSTIDPAEGEQ